MRNFLIAVLLVMPIHGQIENLTTTGDGSVVYFDTPLPRVGTREPQQGRIYEIGPGGLSLFASVVEIDPVVPPGCCPPPTLSSFFSLSNAEVSRDGTVVAYSGTAKCFGSQNACAVSNLGINVQTTVLGVPGRVALNVRGAGRLSGNGRYLLVYSNDLMRNFGDYVLDLQTGARTPLLATGEFTELMFSTSGRVVADNGTVLGRSRGAWVLINAGSAASFGPRSSDQAVIDANAKVVVYVFAELNSIPKIGMCHVAGQTCTILAALPGASYAPLVSADGTRVSFLSQTGDVSQIFTVNTDGTSLRQVTRGAGGVKNFVMSDDGHIAFYWSGSGRIYRLNLDTELEEEKLPSTPELDTVLPFALSPGSVLTLNGVGFSDQTWAAESFPLPTTLGGVAVNINGRSAPLLSVSPTRIVLQAPWETAAASDSVVPRRLADVQVSTDFASPFVPQLESKLPSVSENPTLSVALHEDWSGQVTAEYPAHAGEVLHFYGTGFGSVVSAPPDGVPAPPGPLLPITAPIACAGSRADHSGLSVPVLFAGLAPGLVGYYQVDLRLPSVDLGPTLFISCGVDGSNLGNGYLVPMGSARIAPRRLSL